MVTVHLNIRAFGLSTFYRNQMMNMKMNKDHNSKWPLQLGETIVRL